MARRLLLIIFSAMLLPVWAYAGTYGTLVGKVLDNEGKPLPGASVRILSTDRGANTKVDGKFTIIKINPGTYNVKISAVGYKDHIESISISADQTKEINVKMKTDAKETGTVVVTGKVDAEMTDKTKIGSIAKFATKDIALLPRESVQAVVTQTPGVLDAGNGFNIRGARATETQFRVDGMDIGDQFSGGFGGTPTSYYPTTSSQGTEEVQVLTGGMSAEYGNVIGGVINTVTKSGRKDSYEGYLRYRTDIPSMFGSGSNGLKANAALDNIYEFGVGGPVPAFDDITFFVSGKYNNQKYRSNGLQALDPLGNNLGKLPDNGLWVQNLTGKLSWNLTKSIRLEAGGSYGASSWENSSWSWLYANDYAVFPNGDTSKIQERRAKMNVNNQILKRAFVRLNHDVENSFYELTLSWNGNVSEDSRRSDFNNPGILGTIQTWKPYDNGQLVANPYVGFSSTADKAIDIYTLVTRKDVLLNDGGTAGFVYPFALSVRNPLTGYVEGDLDVRGTKNPYGLNNIFAMHGNEDDNSARGFEFRQSDYIQIDGSYNSIFSTDKFHHSFKAGFEGRVFTLSRHNNSLPWNGNPFVDVYSAQYPDLYASDPATASITSQTKNPMTGAVYAQDQIEYNKIIITPSVRVDYVDPNSLYRTTASGGQFIPVQYLNDTNSANSTKKVRVSPRLFVAYPITDRSNFNLSYGIYYQDPTFNHLFDSYNLSQLRGNSVIGDPNLTPQKSKSYQVGYTNQVTDEISVEATIYYRDLYNIAGVTYVPATPTPYALNSVAEYGNSRGIELTLRKRVTDNVGANLTYTLSSSRTTASGSGSNYTYVVTASEDIFTHEKQAYPLQEYFADYDRTHRINAVLNFVWGANEGPSIGGMKILQNTNVNFTGFYQSGTPYTKLDIKGVQAGDFNAERQPSNWRVDTRLERLIPLKDLLGDVMGNTSVSIFVDIINITNRTAATGNYARTNSPDYDGNSYNHVIGDLAPGNYYATGSNLINQVDTFGNRLYNAAADLNSDGVVTPLERFTMYQKYVADAISRHGNYQFPRQVFFGFMLRF